MANFNSNPVRRKNSSRLRKALSIVLMLAILTAIGALAYIVTKPHAGEKFTEFYILGEDGKAENYPADLVLGEQTGVILGIVNREQEKVSYWVEVKIDEVTSKKIGPILLANEEKGEQEVNFIPTKIGGKQKVEFVLYKYSQDKPYLTLYLWIDVKGY